MPTTAHWSMTTCWSFADERHVAAVRLADGVLVIPDELERYSGLVEALADWERLSPLLRAVEPTVLAAADAVEVAPLNFPRKLICVGANYHDHLAEMGVTSVPEGVEPYFFLLPPSTTIVRSGAEVIIPDDPAANVDYEAELAVVIGRGGRDIALEVARAHVAGYACHNDVTARGRLRRSRVIGPPFEWDWAGAKGLDTFSPLATITPAWAIDDADHLGIRCWVNGELVQDGNVADIIFGIDQLVSAASRNWTLEPGDVIATGTPAGVGQARGRFLRNGDVVRVEIPGLTPLENTIRSRSRTVAERFAAPGH